MARKLRPGIRVEEFIRIDDPDERGTYETFWGRAWVHTKLHDPTKPFMIANELICGRLAAAVGLPTLPGELARDPDGLTDCWAAPRIRTESDTSLPPVSAAAIAVHHPNVVAGMIVFDAWVHNQDRTADNVLFDERLGIWLIDHENSLAEPEGTGFDLNPDQAAKTPLGWHEFADTATDSDAIRFWCQRIELAPVHVIERPLKEANQRGLITKTQQTWIGRYLLARRGQIASLLPTLKNARGTTNVASSLHTEDGLF
ncbi:serine/threonine kinase [Gordonia phage ZiggyZoo]|nr:serine/threonine kinase [Gordonia phage ZiggyZoo]